MRVCGVGSPEGPLLRPATRPACGDATAKARMCPAYDGAPLSRSGVASNDETIGTCSALRGTLCRAACSCAPASVSRSVVRDGAQGGVFKRQWYGASAAAPANGPTANESQPPRYELRHPSRDQSVLASNAHVVHYEIGSHYRRAAWRSSIRFPGRRDGRNIKPPQEDSR